MSHMDLNDGVCANCGNTGLPGEKCLFCGEPITDLGEAVKGLEPEDPDDPQSYPAGTIDDDEKSNSDIISLEEAEEQREDD